MDYDTVRLDEAEESLVIIDQTKLPGKIELLSLKTAQEIWDAIYLLKVRGAPAIGVAAAYGIYLLAKQIKTEDYDTEKILYKVSCGNGTFSCHHSYHGFYPDRIHQDRRS